jgi:hypothetical protein
MQQTLWGTRGIPRILRQRSQTSIRMSFRQDGNRRRHAIALCDVNTYRWILLLPAALLVVAGCSTSHKPAAVKSPTSVTSTTAPRPTVPESPSTLPLTTTTEPVAPTTPAPVPTLGVDLSRAVGFGSARPAEFTIGATGYVTDIHWTSWGGGQADATAVAEYVAPNQSMAKGTSEETTVVAFDLGICRGHLAYERVEWYFSKYGEHFNSSTAANVCTAT